MRSMRPTFPTSGLSPHLYQSQRKKMVELLRRHGIRNQELLQLMEEIPRHLFVPEALAAKAYGDHALPIGHMQTISQPYRAARMTGLLKMGPSSTVLEMGAGSGYKTAIPAPLAGRVLAIKRI